VIQKYKNYLIPLLVFSALYLAGYFIFINNQYITPYNNSAKLVLHIWNFITVAFITFTLILYKKIIASKVFSKTEEEEILQLQIELMKNQLDPHFIFNALNSISFSVNTGDKKNAYHNLGVFSKLMRQSIVEMEEFYRNLEDELTFVKNYLHLEKFRFKEQFNYHIIISPQVNISALVPKMCLFCYVEAALKKGVLTKLSGGNIEIKIDKNDNEDLILSIKDDGIYRDVEKLKSNISTSTTAMKHIVNYYNKHNTNKITTEYTDIGTADNPEGSQIVITIPYGFRF